MRSSLTLAARVLVPSLAPPRRRALTRRGRRSVSSRTSPSRPTGKRCSNKLIPGSQEYYYYRCLERQHAGAFGDVPAILAQWRTPAR